MATDIPGNPQFDDGSQQPGDGAYGTAPGGPARLPLSIGGALSWAWDAVKADPVVLLAGFGIWTVLRGAGAHFEYTVNGEEHGYGFTWGTPVGIIANLLAPIVVAHVCLVVASGRRTAFSNFVTFPNFGQALLTSFLSALATIIGWVVTVPLVFLMSGYAYLRIQGRDAARWAR